MLSQFLNGSFGKWPIRGNFFLNRLGLLHRIVRAPARHNTHRGFDLLVDLRHPSLGTRKAAATVLFMSDHRWHTALLVNRIQRCRLVRQDMRAQHGLAGSRVRAISSDGVLQAVLLKFRQLDRVFALDLPCVVSRFRRRLIHLVRGLQHRSRRVDGVHQRAPGHEATKGRKPHGGLPKGLQRVRLGLLRRRRRQLRKRRTLVECGDPRLVLAQGLVHVAHAQRARDALLAARVKAKRCRFGLRLRNRHRFRHSAI